MTKSDQGTNDRKDRKGDRRFTPYPGGFAHGVDLADWYPCWNLALAQHLASADFTAAVDSGMADVHRSVRDTPLDVLRTGLPLGALTPRAAWHVWAASIIRGGGRVGLGEVNTQWLGQESSEHFLRIGDMELAFEEGRRRILPNGASRLASLYLADDSEVGRRHIRNMLGETTLILRVGVPLARRITRVDTEWFDLYYEDPEPKFIEGYWSLESVGAETPTWEYLVEGMIKADDPAGIARIREVGAHRLLQGPKS